MSAAQLVLYVALVAMLASSFLVPAKSSDFKRRVQGAAFFAPLLAVSLLLSEAPR